MAYSDNDREDYNRSHGSGRGDAGYGSPHKSPTSDFGTKDLMGEDGSFFGFQVSPGVATALKTFDNFFKVDMARYVQTHALPYAEKIATSLGKSPTEAGNIAKVAAQTAGFATIFMRQGGDLAGNAYNTTNAMRELRRAVLPVYVANSGGGAGAQFDALFADRDNSVIRAKREQIRGLSGARGFKTLVDAAANAPILWAHMAEQRERNAEIEKVQLAKQYKDDPKKMAELFRARAKESGEFELIKAKKVTWEETWKIHVDEYKADFAKFETENKSRVEKEMKAALRDKDPTARQKWGISGSSGNYGYGYGEIRADSSGRVSSSAAASYYESLTPQQKKQLDKQVGEVVNIRLQGEFAEKHGALDNEQRTALQKYRKANGWENSDKIETLQEAVKKDFDKIFDKINGIGEGAKKDSKEEADYIKRFQSNLAGVASTVLGEMGQGLLGLKSLEQYRTDRALDMILHLRREQEKNKGQLDSVPARMVGGKQVHAASDSIAKYVHEIFEQNQKDNAAHSYAAISDRYVSHFKEAGWDNKKIQALSDDELTPLEYAEKLIARRIAQGRMDALALVNLVGDSKNHIVRREGNKFGPEGINSRDEKQAKAEIGRLIDAECGKFHQQRKITEAELAEALSDYTFTPAELQAKFADGSPMPRDQQAFLLADLEDNIHSVSELKKLTGRSEFELDALREQGQKNFEKMMDASLAVIAQMAEEQPKKLEALELTDEELNIIKTLAGKLEKGQKDVLESSSREDRKAAEAVVANVIMKEADCAPAADEGEEKNEKKGFWQRVVAVSRGEKAEKKLAKKDKNTRGGYAKDEGGREEEWESGNDDYTTRNEDRDDEPSFASEKLKKPARSLSSRGEDEDGEFSHLAAYKSDSKPDFSQAL